eukprot:scaffold12568_cov40-Phaeocystis_antarctica.AAC.1
MKPSVDAPLLFTKAVSTAPHNDPLHTVLRRCCCAFVRSRAELLASLEDTASTRCAGCTPPALAASHHSQERAPPPSTNLLLTEVHPPTAVGTLWSSSTLLRCAAKRMRTASGLGEAATKLRACGCGDVWPCGALAVFSRESCAKYTPVKRYCFIRRGRRRSREVSCWRSLRGERVVLCAQVLEVGRDLLDGLGCVAAGQLVGLAPQLPLGDGDGADLLRA